MEINDKEKELNKYRDLVIATIDYYLENNLLNVKTEDFDSNEHFKNLKLVTEENFQNGRLSKLKQHFRDLTEMFVETNDFNFNKYLREKLKYEINIFESFFLRIEKIIDKGKITSDSQFYDVNIMVDYMIQNDSIDKSKIELLNRFMFDYEQKKSSKKKF